MEDFKKYNTLLKENKKDEFYRFVLSDIQINVNVIIEELKKKFDMSCWVLYNNDISVSLGYYKTSNDSPENIKKIRNFLQDKLPYFKGLSCYDDDNRLVLNFIEVGNPVKFKFFK